MFRILGFGGRISFGMGGRRGTRVARSAGASGIMVGGCWVSGHNKVGFGLQVSDFGFWGSNFVFGGIGVLHSIFWGLEGYQGGEVGRGERRPTHFPDQPFDPWFGGCGSGSRFQGLAGLDTSNCCIATSATATCYLFSIDLGLRRQRLSTRLFWAGVSGAPLTFPTSHSTPGVGAQQVRACGVQINHL